MIKAVIFDLDMCIFDTTSLGPRFVDPVLNPLRSSQMSSGMKAEIEHAFWTMPLEDVFKRFRIPSVVEQSMRAVQKNLTAPDWIKTYGDENVLQHLHAYRVLVTTGYRVWQMSKIEKLNIAHLFSKVIIDEIDDPSQRLGKRAIFQDLLLHHFWEAREVLVVGDSATSELKAGKELGMITVQTVRPKIKKVEGFDHYVTTLDELLPIVETYSRSDVV